MKPLLFVGDLCFWLLLLSLVIAYTFPYSRTYIQAFCLILINSKLSQLHYQQNYVPNSQGNFNYPRTVTRTYKNDVVVQFHINGFSLAYLFTLTSCDKKLKWNTFLGKWMESQTFLRFEKKFLTFKHILN